jgi:hypothetical protein
MIGWPCHSRLTVSKLQRMALRPCRACINCTECVLMSMIAQSERTWLLLLRKSAFGRLTKQDEPFVGQHASIADQDGVL